MFRSHQAYRSAWDHSYQKDPAIPLNIDIELASLCNLNCPFCFISDGSFDEMIRQPSEDGKSRRRLMPKDLAFKIIDEAAKIGVPALKFNWRGESTIHPNYFEIIQYARNKDILLQKRNVNTIGEIPGIEKVSTPVFFELLANTNANCKESAIPGLLATTKCMISLDSLNPQTYAKMRVGGNLELVKINIWKLVTQHHPNLWIRRVITKENKNEDFYSDVRREWGDTVKISEHYCFDRNTKSIHEIDEFDENERQYCGYPSQRLVIASTGLVYPCCIDLHEEMPVGNIRKESILDIWNGGKMRILRDQLRNNIFQSKICQNCQSWMAYKSKKRDFVQDIEVKKDHVRNG